MTKNQPPYYGQDQQQPPYGGYPSQGQYPPQGQRPTQGQYPPSNPFPPQSQLYPTPTQPYSPQGSSPYPPQPSYPNYNASPPAYGAAADYYGTSAPPALSPEQLQAKPNANDDERGVLGALGGAAAGGYAGHKMNHGIIGTVGGAYAGHKVEDAWKAHHNKPESGAPAPPQGPPPAYSHEPQVGMRGNFSSSSARINLDRDYDLIAECRAVSGEERMSSISLGKHLGNDDGHFVWVNDEGNFGVSAQNVRLLEDGRVLEAELRDRQGEWRWARVRLDERVGNSDGELVFVA